MGEVLKKLFTAIDKLPLSVQIIALLFIAAAIVAYRMLKNKKVQALLMAKLQKQIHKLNKEDLIEHRLFSKQAVYENFIDTIRFESVNKTNVFRKILEIKLSNDVNTCIKFFERTDLEKISQTELCTEMIRLVNIMAKVHEEKTLDSLKSYYGHDIGQKLFDYVMDTPGGWRHKRIDRMNRVIYQIDVYLRTSAIFDNNVERMEFFFTEIHYALRIAILESEKMFTKLNGQFDKLVDNK